MWLAPVRKCCSMVPTRTRCRRSLNAEIKDGLASCRRPQAQRLRSCVYSRIPEVGTSLATEKEEGLASGQRPQARRSGSCTVASLMLAHVSSCRQKKGSSRIDAHVFGSSCRYFLVFPCFACSVALSSAVSIAPILASWHTSQSIRRAQRPRASNRSSTTTRVPEYRVHYKIHTVSSISGQILEGSKFLIQCRPFCLLCRN